MFTPASLCFSNGLIELAGGINVFRDRPGASVEITAEELSGVDTRPFGLDEPVVVATLAGSGGRGLTVRFGALNPEGFLQYMRIDGDPKLYLMSRFIGAEWLAALEGVTAR